MRRLAPLIKCDDAATLSRKSLGLSDAHVQFIKLLAQIAVENYLSEGDAQPVIGSEQ